MTASDSSSGPSRFDSTMAQVAPEDAIVRAEALLSRTLFAGPGWSGQDGDAAIKREPSANDAVLAAAALASRGERAAVLLRASEVRGALDALDRAAASRSPLVVHVQVSVSEAEPSRDVPTVLLGGRAGVVMTSSAQEAVDTTLALRRAAEDSESTFIHVSDALPSAGSVSLFARDAAARFLDGERRVPRAPGAVLAANDPRQSAAHRRADRSFAGRVPFALASALREAGELLGRPMGPFERVDTQDADELIVAVGAATPAVRLAIPVFRREGRRVGGVLVRSLQPFFRADLVKTASRARAIVVMEPYDSPLVGAGPVATALKAAFADALTWAPGYPGVGRVPPVVSALFATLDGPVSEDQVRAALDEIAAGERARRLVVFGSDEG